MLQSVGCLSWVSVCLLTLSPLGNMHIRASKISLHCKIICSEIGLGGVKLPLLLKKSRLYVDLVQAFDIMKVLYKLEQDK